MQTGMLKAGEGKAYWVVGDLYTILASGEDTGGAYALIHTEVPPGGGPPPHVHRREDEAFYVLEGELAFHADGRDIRARAVAWVMLARGSLHTFKNAGPLTARMLIVVTPSGLERFLASVLANHPASQRDEGRTAPSMVTTPAVAASKWPAFESDAACGRNASISRWTVRNGGSSRLAPVDEGPWWG